MYSYCTTESHISTDISSDQKHDQKQFGIIFQFTHIEVKRNLEKNA